MMNFPYRFLLPLLLIGSSLFAQNALDAAYLVFKQEFEAYRDSPIVASENSTIKPGPCGQYNLQYMITLKGTDEVVSEVPARKLCYDMARFDKAKNKELPADWEYIVKAVGDKYYVITAEKKGKGAQEVYYYLRNPKK